MRIALKLTLTLTRDKPAPDPEPEQRDTALDALVERSERYPIGFTGQVPAMVQVAPVMMEPGARPSPPRR